MNRGGPLARQPGMGTRARVAVAAAATLGAASLAACGDDGATASFTTPSGDETVAGGVAFSLVADGVTIEEAGDVRGGAGHFHVIADAGCIEEGSAVPRDADHVHLGGGQADGVVYLAPGTHELCVQVADGAHTATDITETITVDVGVTSREQWCAVAAETDDLFLATDESSDEDFAVRQAGYEGIRRLLAQLTAGIGHVDADARQDVGAGLSWATGVAAAFTDASSVAEAEAALAPLFADGGAVDAAEPWIRQNCDVDIND